MVGEDQNHGELQGRLRGNEADTENSFSISSWWELEAFALFLPSAQASTL